MEDEAVLLRIALRGKSIASKCYVFYTWAEIECDAGAVCWTGRIKLRNVGQCRRKKRRPLEFKGRLDRQCFIREWLV